MAICLASGFTYSQSRNSDVGSSGQNRGQQDYGPGKKKPEAKKDTVVFKMKVYQLYDGYSQLKKSNIDTSFVDYQTYNPLMKNSLTAQTLGNMGSSAQSNNYFDRSFEPGEFLFLKNYKYFGKWPKDIQF
jgi:hypothetical protein